MLLVFIYLALCFHPKGLKKLMKNGLNTKRLIFLQGDDPPYLTVGTEVSAKYKGAFCEAKVRKVVRSVKCKVCINKIYKLSPY
jgi:DNA-binding sugar fermentation-stimulating protein